MNLEYTRNKNFPVASGPKNLRKAKALAMMKMGLEPRKIRRGVYLVPSQTHGGIHIVLKKGGMWNCTCLDKTEAKNKCKHIFLVQQWLHDKQLAEPYQDIPVDIEAVKALFKGCAPRRIKENVYTIKSPLEERSHLILKVNKRWRCTCPDNLFMEDCDHIFLLEIWLESEKALEEYQEKPKEEVQELDPSSGAVCCVYCGSADIVKNGSRKTKNGCKTRYLCRACNHAFVVNPKGFHHMEFKPEIVTLCLDLYFKGTSLRKIQDHLRGFYQADLHWTTIGKWAQKYSEIIEEYVKTLEPQVSGKWRADEMMIKLKQNGGEWAWTWNVIDEETRFLLATTVTKERGMKEARKVFRQAKEQAKARPSEVITDGLWSYQEAFRKEFYARRGQIPRLIQNAGPSKEVHNNKVERLHGTMREREKVMRALSNGKSSDVFMKGFKNYYNFVRPHLALKGKTPAEAAGLSLELRENKWEGLIEKASEHLGRK